MPLISASKILSANNQLKIADAEPPGAASLAEKLD